CCTNQRTTKEYAQYANIGERITEFCLRHCWVSAPRSCLVSRLVISMLKRAAYRSTMSLAEAVMSVSKNTVSLYFPDGSRQRTTVIASPPALWYQRAVN